MIPCAPMETAKGEMCVCVHVIGVEEEEIENSFSETLL